jgi:hypothetical protein
MIMCLHHLQIMLWRPTETRGYVYGHFTVQYLRVEVITKGPHPELVQSVSLRPPTL